MQRLRVMLIPSNVTGATQPSHIKRSAVVAVRSLDPHAGDTTGFACRRTSQYSLLDSLQDFICCLLANLGALGISSTPALRLGESLLLVVGIVAEVVFRHAISVSRVITTASLNALVAVKSIGRSGNLNHLLRVTISPPLCCSSSPSWILAPPLLGDDSAALATLGSRSQSKRWTELIDRLRLAALRARLRVGKRRGIIESHRTPPTSGARPLRCISIVGASSRQLYQLTDEVIFKVPGRTAA